MANQSAKILGLLCIAQVQTQATSDAKSQGELSVQETVNSD